MPLLDVFLFAHRGRGRGVAIGVRAGFDAQRLHYMTKTNNTKKNGRRRVAGLREVMTPTDLYADARVEALFRDTGSASCLDFFRLLEEWAFHENGYFLALGGRTDVSEMGHDVVAEAARTLSVSSDKLTKVWLPYLLRKGFFDRGMYHAHGVLTSRSMQERYLKMCRRLSRKERIIDQYSLMSCDEPIISAGNEITSAGNEITSAGNEITSAEPQARATVGIFDYNDNNNDSTLPLPPQSSAGVVTAEVVERELARGSERREALWMVYRRAAAGRAAIGSADELDAMVREFVAVQTVEGKRYRDATDAVRHLNSWLRLRLERQRAMERAAEATAKETSNNANNNYANGGRNNANGWGAGGPGGSRRRNSPEEMQRRAAEFCLDVARDLANGGEEDPPAPWLGS